MAVGMISNCEPSPAGLDRSKKETSGFSWMAPCIESARIGRLKVRTMLRSGAIPDALSDGSTEVSTGGPSVLKRHEWSSVFCWPLASAYPALIDTVYWVERAKLTLVWMNIRLLPVQAKRQFLDPLQPGSGGERSKRRSTESWFMGRSKPMLTVWLFGTSVTSRPGEMLTMRGGFRAHETSAGARTAIRRSRATKVDAASAVLRPAGASRSPGWSDGPDRRT